MSNAILAYPDRILAAATTLTGGSWLSALPLVNLKDPDPKKVARSTDLNTASTTFSVDLGSVMDIRVIYLLGHNASKSGMVRIRAGAVSDFSDSLYDQTKPFYFAMYPVHGLPLGHPDYESGGTMPDELITAFPKQLVAVLTSNYSLQVRYLRFDISEWSDLGQQYSQTQIMSLASLGGGIVLAGTYPDGKILRSTDASNPAGYFELGRCFIAPAWQPSRNLLYGVTFGLETATQSVESRGGSEFFDVRAYRRVTQFNLSLTAAQGLALIFEMQRRLGIHNELLFVRNPDDATMVEQLRSFLCTLRELSPIEDPYCNRSAASYRLKEKL